MIVMMMTMIVTSLCWVLTMSWCNCFMRALCLHHRTAQGEGSIHSSFPQMSVSKLISPWNCEVLRLKCCL